VLIRPANAEPMAFPGVKGLTDQSHKVLVGGSPIMHAKGATRLVFAVLLLLTPVFLSSVKTEQGNDYSTDRAGGERWEYLVVSNPNRTNFQPTGNANMRKEEMGSFGAEAFVLEQHLDRLGGKGWELIAVSGTSNDPIFYFKRPKSPRR
jgi:hypothetical protein